MAPRIYTSSIPPVPIVNTSIFTHLFSSPSDDPNIIGGFPGSVPAFIDAVSGTTITRAQLKHLALSLGYGLRHHPITSSKVGDTILIYSPNNLAWPVVLFGSVAAGLKCTFANSAYTSRELAYQYTDSRANLVISSEDGLDTVKAMFKELGVRKEEADRRIIVLGSGLGWAGGPEAAAKPEAAGLLRVDQLLGLGKLAEEEKVVGELARETVYLCYSSGTTGKPKGVESTHQNMTSLMDIEKPVFPKLTVGTDIVLGTLPFYHIYGAVQLLHFPFACGTPVVIQARFDPDQFCENIQKYRITAAFIVPPVLVVLSRHPAVDKYDLSTLQIVFSGAAPLGAALVHQVVNRLHSKRKGTVKCHIMQGYGLTETSPTTHLLPAADSLRKVGSVGILLPNLEARLVIDGDGDGNFDAEEGQRGEIWIRGPTVMKGYLNNVAATEDSITKDGWFKTGDIAVRDPEGYYWIVDRRKELIKYKGFQVPPAELESVLLTHPDIADAAVIGIYSQKEATELPRAYIVHAHPERLRSQREKDLFAKHVSKWVEGKVARHKFLRGGVVVIDVIPKSAAGKILRRELRDRAKVELAKGELNGGDIIAKL